MNYDALFQNIKNKESFLCVGLDSDIELIPEHLRSLPEPIFEFNKAIIDATAQYCIAYKPNFAFYETTGSRGWIQLEKSIRYIKDNYPDILIIADAKRGDIGNTASYYAKSVFKELECDAVTLSPYMGFDSVEPFLSYRDKWSIVLGLTSNPSAEDFETIELKEGILLYEKVIRETITKTDNLLGAQGASKNNLMFVIGATRPEKMAEIRKYCPDHFFLVPGVGAQGGSLKEVAKHGLNSHCGLIINASRSIIFADRTENFAAAAAREAKKIANEMKEILNRQ